MLQHHNYKTKQFIMSIFFIPTSPLFNQGLSTIDLDINLSRTSYLNKLKTTFFTSRPNIIFPFSDFEIIFNFLIVLRLQTWTDLLSKQKSLLLINTIGLPKYLDTFTSLLPNSTYINIGSGNPIFINGPQIINLTQSVQNNINNDQLRQSIINCLQFVNQINKNSELWVNNYVPQTNSFSVEYKNITDITSNVNDIKIYTNSKQFSFCYTSLYTLMFLPHMDSNSLIKLPDWNLLCNNNYSAVIQTTNFVSDLNLILDWLFNGNNTIKRTTAYRKNNDTRQIINDPSPVPDSTPDRKQNNYILDDKLIEKRIKRKSSPREQNNTLYLDKLETLVRNFIGLVLNDEILSRDTKDSISKLLLC